MKTSTFSTLAAMAVLVPMAAASALEVDPNVPPEISLGGQFIGTVNVKQTDQPTGGDDLDAELDIADTSVLVGLAKYIFTEGDYAYGAFGLVVPEDDSDLDDAIFIHQAFVGVGGPNYDLQIGRSQLPNTLIAFPTIRDDDLLGFTHVGNAHANVEAEEDQIYGGIASGTLFLGNGRYRLTATGTARAETDLSNLASTERESRFSLNGGALTFAYDVPEEIKFDAGLRFLGVTIDWQRAGALGSGDDEDIVAVVGGTTINLSDNPEASWAIDLQGIYNFGDGTTSLAEAVQRARAEHYSVVGGLRYTSRPFLQTDWQAAITAAWRDYPGIDDAASIALVPSFAWRIGSGIDVVAEYIFEANGDALASAENVDTKHTGLIGIRFALDTTFNESVGARGSILNLEHDMLDAGPTGIGH